MTAVDNKSHKMNTLSFGKSYDRLIRDEKYWVQYYTLY